MSPPGNNSDRDVLLKEIKTLSQEIVYLREDTRGFVQEEVRRARWRNLALGAVAFIMLAVPLGLFFLAEQRNQAENKAFNKRVLEFERETVSACQKRNAALANDREFAKNLILAFSQGNGNGGRKEFLEIVKEYEAGLGDTVDCGRRERLLER